MEVWGITKSLPGVALAAAKQAEIDGWTGLCFSDSQSRSADPYVAMSAVATSTSRLRMSTGVTNPATRHPSVTASAIASVQVVSDGRAELGIGRGDSSLAHLGSAPAPVKVFERYLGDLAAYLHGESAPLREFGMEWTSLNDGVPLASVPGENRLEWLELAEVKPVPIWAVASGPRVIKAAAGVVDRVMLAVGASSARVRWGIEQARAVRSDIQVGAYVNVVVGEDKEQLRSIAAGGVAGMARFSAMHGTAVGAMDDRERAVVESIPTRYDMTRHFQSSNRAAVLPPDFVDEYAILGSPTEVLERVHHLVELGVDRLHVLGPVGDADPQTARVLRRNFVEKVLPALVAMPTQGAR
jgi:5,10-methylenetetrahydromethanopterin reductase